MFEEVCLVCGKYLQDDGRAYCSDDCQSNDISSPSISSASSVLSSPHLGYAAGSEVPALLPSALGFALTKHRGRDRYSISSSSASSTSWSVPTDDEEDEPALGINTEYNYQFDGAEQIYDSYSKPNSKGPSIWSAALSYARLPSGTNNRSTVPQLHKRTSSVSPGHVHVMPRSAPISSHSSAEEEDGYSDFGLPSRDTLEVNENTLQPYLDNDRTSAAAKSKRNRNRASLPACFSLLQLSGPAHEARSSIISSSSGNTIPRPSPPTPKLVLSTALPHLSTINSSTGLSSQVTPRGRRRVPGNSVTSRRSGHSSSPSRSRSRMYRAPPLSPDLVVGVPSHRPDYRGKVEQEQSSECGLVRGRTACRRNSSPPPKMQPPTIDLHHHHRVCRKDVDTDCGGARACAKTRGRLRAEDLGDTSSDAPGYGTGRSGLVDRERAFGTRPTLYY